MSDNLKQINKQELEMMLDSHGLKWVLRAIHQILTNKFNKETELGNLNKAQDYMINCQDIEVIL